MLSAEVTQQDLDMIYDRIYDRFALMVADGVDAPPLMIGAWLENHQLVRMIPEPVPYMFESSRSKSMIPKMVKILQDETGAQVVVVVCEAWAVEGQVDACDEVPPSEHPDRFEAIVFNFYTKGDMVAVFCKLDRDQRTLTKGKLEAFSSVSGNLAAVRSPLH